MTFALTTCDDSRIRTALPKPLLVYNQPTTRPGEVQGQPYRLHDVVSNMGDGRTFTCTMWLDATMIYTDVVSMSFNSAENDRGMGYQTKRTNLPKQTARR